MLFDYLNFIGSFFEESIFHFFLCHVPGRFIRMKDKMDMKTIMNTSRKIFPKENKYLKKTIVSYVELHNIKVKTCCGSIPFKYIFNILSTDLTILIIELQLY